MDKINFQRQDFVDFMNSCDLIGTSGLSMVKHLNLKRPWKIEHFPNGYYEFEDTKCDKDCHQIFSKKENVILTVGRIGSAQKANDVLLEAFANISEENTDWKLYLEGGTPNVIAEALSCGCVVSISKIDAWQEAINYGKCGVAFEINNVWELSEKLNLLCNNDNLEKMSANAFSYSRAHFDMEKITADIFNKLQGD